MKNQAKLIETVAREICEADGQDPDEIFFEPYPDQNHRKEYPAWEDYKPQARAAVIAVEAAHEDIAWVPFWLAINGLDAKDAEEQCDLFMNSRLRGLLRSGEQSIREALLDQLKAAEARGALKNNTKD